MSRKSGRSSPNLWGGYDHYDENGKKVGSSVPDLFGGFTEYDEKGKKVGRSSPSIFGGYNHYDNQGKRTGSSRPDLFDTGYNHYDANGKKTGSSTRGVFGGYRTAGSSGNTGFSGKQSQGCYIATCVYGSYDCPPVRILRRFRDEFLAKHLLGRAFIRFYYFISPGLVKRFGKCVLFRKTWKAILDRFVKKLKNRNYSDSPYADQEN